MNKETIERMRALQEKIHELKQEEWRLNAAYQSWKHKRRIIRNIWAFRYTLVTGRNQYLNFVQYAQIVSGHARDTEMPHSGVIESDKEMESPINVFFRGNYDFYSVTFDYCGDTLEIRSTGDIFHNGRRIMTDGVWVNEYVTHVTLKSTENRVLEPGMIVRHSFVNPYGERVSRKVRLDYEDDEANDGSWVGTIWDGKFRGRITTLGDGATDEIIEVLE